MNDANDFASGLFGADSPEEKSEAFEESSLRVVLQQIGWTAPAIQKERSELGPAFGWDWFNDLNLIGARVGSCRSFRFNFFELIHKPARHPITEAFKEFRGTDPDPCCLIFYVYQEGRWVATNLKTDDDSSIHVVTGDTKFNVLPCTNFFKNRWNEAHE